MNIMGGIDDRLRFIAEGLFNSSPKHEQKLKKVEKRY